MRRGRREINHSMGRPPVNPAQDAKDPGAAQDWDIQPFGPGRRKLKLSVETATSEDPNDHEEASR
jgi:hypothetical protein